MAGDDNKIVSFGQDKRLENFAGRMVEKATAIAKLANYNIAADYDDRTDELAHVYTEMADIAEDLFLHSIKHLSQKEREEMFLDALGEAGIDIEVRVFESNSTRASQWLKKAFTFLNTAEENLYHLKSMDHDSPDAG